MQRLYELSLANRTLSLPAYFPSVSSVKTNLSVADYVQLLVGVGFPSFLVSAYDYQHATSNDRQLINDYLRRAKENGAVVLLDSGNYEAFWLRDKAWNPELFHGAANQLMPTFAFSFDDQNPPDEPEGSAHIAAKRARVDSDALSGYVVIPIVHARSTVLPRVVGDVVRELHPPMIAVAERELGDGINERCRTIAALRTRLNELEYYCPIHVLGTGNPYSLFALALSGADSFDGLEWCQTVADYSTGQLSHFQHWALFASTSPLSKAEDLPYQQRTLAHNLVFWSELMRCLREFIRYGNSTALADGILARIRPVLPVHIP